MKVTVPVELPKLEPSMVTPAPTSPELGSRLEMEGVFTVKATPALACPPEVVTTTFPEVAPDGTVVSISSLAQLEVEAEVPLKVTVPVELPKLEPSMVTPAPTSPELGSRLEITGAGGVTVKVVPELDLLAEFVTTTFPVVAPTGTRARITSWLQLEVVAVVPLKVTLPPELPKLDPLILTLVPTAPESGSSLEMDGVPRVTVKVTPLLATPPEVVTTTDPVVAVDGTTARTFLSFQPAILDALTPLKVTEPWVSPKFRPLILTSVPTGPESGSSLSMVGPVGVSVTVKVTPALDWVPTVTTTGPVVAPSGTDVLILPSSQLSMSAPVPLKVTVPSVVPKLDPLIWTLLPTRPESGFNSLMAGVDD